MKQPMELFCSWAHDNEHIIGRLDNRTVRYLQEITGILEHVFGLKRFRDTFTISVYQDYGFPNKTNNQYDRNNTSITLIIENF